MPRTGVTYLDVADAAESLVSEGANPTIEHVRRKLGTGSSTTISTHLREWKARIAGVDVNAMKDKLPQDLMTMVKGLWERVIDQSQEKIQTISTDSAQKEQVILAELEKYKKNNKRWQRLYFRWMEEHEKNQQFNRELEQALTALKQDNRVLTVEKDNLIQQSGSKQIQLVELKAQLDEVKMDNQLLTNQVDVLRDKLHEHELQSTQLHYEQDKQIAYLQKRHHEIEAALQSKEEQLLSTRSELKLAQHQLNEFKQAEDAL